jgi:phospholipid/cholesterol/gamma-HCH transport system substrate-binding protein
MKKYNREFKVGLFVIFCLLALFYLIYSTGKLDIKKNGYHIYVIFDDIAALENKAPVFLNGLEVGKVDDIKIVYDNNKTRIMLKLWLKSRAKIRENPVISIKTLGLMGEKYIHILTMESENFVKPDTVLTGKPYLDLDMLMEQAQILSHEISQQINKLLITVTNTVDMNKDSISQIIKNLEVTSKNFEEFSADLKRHPWKLLFRTKEKTEKGKKN